MTRARNIKPGFYKNEDLAECSVWARFIFPGLWMMADREGRLEDRPKRIKGELLPYDAQDVEPLLRELASRGFIVRYKIGDQSFIEIPKFRTHQSPHYSEKPSVIKPPGFRENEPDIQPAISEKPQPIKRGSQPPDSLNPDSLNHECGKKQGAFAPPGWVPIEAWDAWLEVRKRKKSPNTEHALRLAIKDLDAFRGEGVDPADVLDQSTKRGWTGLFDPRNRGVNGQQRPNARAAAARSIGLGESTHGAIDGLATRVE